MSNNRNCINIQSVQIHIQSPNGLSHVAMNRQMNVYKLSFN